ncbi:MAG: ATP-binding protein [Dehalococcoidales bacterium]|nr:ATP-binding protein [Dehalococcoidales bacterium]
MFRSIKWRIIFWFVLLTVVSMTVFGILLSNSVKNTQLDNLAKQLENEARIVSEVCLPYLSNTTDINLIDALVKTLGADIDERITVIAIDGVVLGDSHENPAVMENHSTRLEVKEALSSGYGESVRYSTTLNEKMMYVAVLITDGQDVYGITRVALPVTQVDILVNSIINSIILATILTAALIIVAILVITPVTTRPITEITRAARRIASGDFDYRITAGGNDESGQLARAFNEMRLKLKDMIEKISADRAELSTILENMTDGIIMTDREGNITLVNTACLKIMNASGNGITTKPLIEVFRDHQLNEILRQCLNTGKQQTTQFESIALKKFIQAFAVPISSDGLNGALILLQDLTELRSLQTTRRELIGNISHEFRTPLAGIKAMAQTLQDGAIEERDTAKDFLNRIEAEVDRLTQMVSELTELSRIENGKVGLKTEIVDINKLIAEVLAQLQPQADRQNLDLKCEFKTGQLLVKADRERIRQVIINLVHNAIKFSKPGKAITTVSRKQGIFAAIEITDEGIGISKDDLIHIFERFYKADKSRSGQGTGMGLAIAKHLVQAHGGIISATSEEGKGTTITFTLPLV